MEKVEIARYFDPKTRKTIVITIQNYDEYIKHKDKPSIAEFIFNRLQSRYITPYKYRDKIYTDRHKNGFSLMASYCLLIETLQSFINGWGDSNRRSEKAFKQFFTNNDHFQELNGMGADVYKHVRCGILHQGETTSGWKITRDGCVLYEPDKKLLNAVLFGSNLEKSISDYKDLLISSEWDSEVWDNFRTKMRKTIAHCK